MSESASIDSQTGRVRHKWTMATESSYIPAGSMCPCDESWEVGKAGCGFRLELTHGRGFRLEWLGQPSHEVSAPTSDAAAARMKRWMGQALAREAKLFWIHSVPGMFDPINMAESAMRHYWLAVGLMMLEGNLPGIPDSSEVSK